MAVSPRSQVISLNCASNTIPFGRFAGSRNVVTFPSAAILRMRSPFRSVK